MEKESILGISVCSADKNAFIAELEQDIALGRRRFIVAINPEKILKARKDKELADLLNSADYQIPDGIGVVLASRMKRGNIRERITGIDSMDLLCASAETHAYGIFLYGARPDVLVKAKAALERKYEHIHIVGFHDGYSDNRALADKINASGADIVFVAMGSPKQEYWIAENRDRLCAKIYQGVGGSFDVIAGELRRAPRWIQKAGLEWLFRLLQQPSRVFRQLKLIGFIFLLIADKGRQA